MPLSIDIKGGVGHAQRIDALSQQQAVELLGRIKAQVNLPNKQSGVFALVNRNKADANIELSRKSGLQLWGRGIRNERLNQTRDFMMDVLIKSGHADAADRLGQYLDAKPPGLRNRVEVSFIQELLNDIAEPGSAQDAATGPAAAAGSRAPAAAATSVYRVKPPLAQGDSLEAVRQQLGLQLGKALGKGGFGVVNEATLAGDARPLVVKTFLDGQTRTLSTNRAQAPQESIAAYLVRKKDPGFANRAGVAETRYFTVSVKGRFQTVDSLGLRALIKTSPKDSVLLHELIMDRAAGTTAHDAVFNSPSSEALTPKQCRSLARQTYQSIVHLHGANIVARDHKWANVMYDRATDKATLIDTGMFYKASKLKPKTRLISGDGAGTPVYMQPRAIAGRRHGRETDLHAQAIMTLQLAQPVWVAGRMLQGLLEPAVAAVERNARNADTALTPDTVRAWADSELEGLASEVERLKQEAARLRTKHPQSPDVKAADRKVQLEEYKLKLVQQFRADLDDPDSLAHFGLQCLEYARRPAEQWADTDLAMQWHRELLNHPSIA